MTGIQIENAANVNGLFFEGFDFTVANVVPVFIEFMTPAGAILSKNHRTVIMRGLSVLRRRL